MIKKALLFFLTLLMPSLLLATDFEEIAVQNQQRVDLSNADSSIVWLRLDYPGTKYCAIELDSTIPVQKILDAFSFSQEPSHITTNTARFSLPDYRYVSWVQIQTSSSATMKNTLKQLGTSLHAYAIPCDAHRK